VGTMTSRSDFINKGFDLFIQLAERNQAISFTLIGIPARYIHWVEGQYKVSRIPNLTIIQSFCPDEVLFKSYNQAKVFVQASITEGMPNTLNEAMLCGCIPVGSDVNGIPDAIGTTGVIVKHRNIDELEQAIYVALTMKTEEHAIQHVVKNYTHEIRASRILSLINSFENN
ncbi:MAG: glycosyltransferase family 4 protein, partial [Bacteroidota bacterium]